ncbi:hypothetical protein EDB89DRAFT_107363 [Lactarius sanguifluus]|nr:hypothetical protein EDB89DRAFT_107363 [Lactarius sanguifluus]
MVDAVANGTNTVFCGVSGMADPNHSTSALDQPLSDKPSILDIHREFPREPNQQANPTITHPNASSSSNNSLFPPNAHEPALSPQERGLMEDITLDPDDPAAWLWSPNDASLPNPNATFDLLQPRSPVPAVASASSSVSPSPFAPPSRSSPPERENDMTAISVTGPGDDPAPVSRENDGETDPERNSTDNDVEMRDLDFESQPPPGPATGASRRSTSSQSRVPSRRMSKTPLFLPSPSPESTSSEPPIRQRD